MRENGELYLPIIPLLGSAEKEVEPLPWPGYSRGEFERLTGQVKARLDAVAQSMIRKHFPNFALRLGAKLLWSDKRREALDKIMGLIKQDLIKHQLMTQ
jgi:hypothetical protein